MHRINLAICSTGELYGGVEQFIYTFSCYLRSNTDFNVTVILFNSGVLSSRLSEAGIEIFVIKTHFKYDPTVVLRVLKIFKEKKIDIVHTHGYKANIICSAAAKIYGAKAIKTEHGKMEPSRGIGRFKTELNHMLDRFVSRACLNEIVYVSKDIQEHYERAYKKIKGTVIYNGISKPEIERGRRLKDFDCNAFNIGIVGRLTEVKGHKYLLEALKELSDLRDIKVNIFGDGSLEDALKRYCVENGLIDRVVFHGFKNDIHSYISALDLLVMPSLHEGLPYTLLEAMYLKIPIIASDVGGIKEILKDGKEALLIRPMDTKGLSEAIKTVYQDPVLEKQLIEGALSKLKSHYLIEGMAQKYIQIFSA